MESAIEEITPIPPSQSMDSDPNPIQVSPPPPQSNNSLVPVLVMLIVILLGISGFFAYTYFVRQNEEPTPEITMPLTPSPAVEPTETQNNVVTANWIQYSNEKQGITFKYPKDWHAKPYAPNTFSVFLDVNPINIPDASEYLTPIHVGYNEATDTVTNKKYYIEKTLAEGVERYKAMLAPESVRMREHLTVGGKEAVQLSGVLAPGMLEGEFAQYTLIQLDDKLLVISLLINKEYQEIYDQLVSTFSFTQ